MFARLTCKLGNTADEKFFAQFVVFVFGAFALRELRRGRFGQRSNEKLLEDILLKSGKNFDELEKWSVRVRNKGLS